MLPLNNWQNEINSKDSPLFYLDNGKQLSLDPENNKKLCT